MAGHGGRPRFDGSEAAVYEDQLAEIDRDVATGVIRWPNLRSSRRWLRCADWRRRSDRSRQLDRVKKILAVAIAIGVMMESSAAFAVQPDEIMADPVKEVPPRNPA